MLKDLYFYSLKKMPDPGLGSKFQKLIKHMKWD